MDTLVRWYLEVRRLIKEERGPTTIQWVLLTVMLTVVAIGIMWAFREAIGELVRYFLDIIDAFRPPTWSR